MINTQLLPRILFYLYKNSSFIRFLCTGILNTCFGYSLFSLFIFLQLNYILACFLSNCIAIFFNFKITGKMVFNNADNRLFLRYIAVYGVTFLISIILIRLCLFFIHNMYINGMISILLTACITYLLQKRFVFQRMPI